MWMILAVFSSGLALADAIGWPDEDPCPPGSQYTARHAYSYCMRSDLESLDCADGEEPGEVHVCAEVTTKSCNSGRMPNEEPCRFEALEIFSACDGDEGDSDCDRGTCQPSVACLTETSEDRDEDNDQGRDKDDADDRDEDDADDRDEDDADDRDEDDDDDRDKDDDDDKKRSDKSDCGCQASRAQMGTMALFLGLFGVGLLHRRS